MIPHILTLPEAAAILRVSERQMQAWVRRGLILGFRLPDGKHPWRTTDLALMVFMGFKWSGFPAGVEQLTNTEALRGRWRREPNRREHPGSQEPTAGVPVQDQPPFREAETGKTLTSYPSPNNTALGPGSFTVRVLG